MGLFAWQIDGTVGVNLNALARDVWSIPGNVTGQFLVEMQVYCVLVSKFYSMQLFTYVCAS